MDLFGGNRGSSARSPEMQTITAGFFNFAGGTVAWRLENLSGGIGVGLRRVLCCEKGGYVQGCVQAGRVKRQVVVSFLAEEGPKRENLRGG